MNTQNTTPINETDLDPAIIAHFEQKYAPVISKRDELLGKLSSVKSLEKELTDLGGLETLKGLKAQADAAAQAAEQARLAALGKDGKITEIEDFYKKQLADRDEKISARDKRLVNKEVDLALSAAIAEAEGSAKLLIPHLRSRIEARLDENGEVVIVAKGSSGQTLNGLAELIAEFKGSAEYAPAFKAHQSSGGGSKKTVSGAKGDNPFAANTVNITAQMALIKQSPDLARTLAKEAGVNPSW